MSEVSLKPFVVSSHSLTHCTMGSTFSFSHFLFHSWFYHNTSFGGWVHVRVWDRDHRDIYASACMGMRLQRLSTWLLCNRTQFGNLSKVTRPSFGRVHVRVWALHWTARPLAVGASSPQPPAVDASKLMESLLSLAWDSASHEQCPFLQT